MEHVQPFDRPFPWRAAALAAAAVALAELTALLALAGARIFHVHHGATAQRTPHTAAAQPRSTGRAVSLRPRSRVSVLVLNGNGVSGAAGTEASKLLADGYGRATAADAPQAYASSLALFRPGWEQEAKRLARDAAIRAVAPLDGRLDTAGAKYRLVLILGGN